MMKAIFTILHFKEDNNVNNKAKGSSYFRVLNLL